MIKLVEKMSDKLGLSDRERAIIPAVLQAGEKLVEFRALLLAQSDQDNALCISEKADGSYVTKADLAANEILVRELAKAYPDAQICSEETGYQGTTAKTADTWFIDPLDGTSNFIRGEDDFLVLISLCREGRPVYSLAFFPVWNELLIAKAGQGAYSSETGRLAVGAYTAYSPTEINLRDLKTKQSEHYQSGFHTGTAQVKLAKADLAGCAFRVGAKNSPKSWDFAAFDLIIYEAGGIATDELGRVINYSGASFAGRAYVASANSTIHEQTLGRLIFS